MQLVVYEYLPNDFLYNGSHDRKSLAQKPKVNIHLRHVVMLNTSTILYLNDLQDR